MGGGFLPELHGELDAGFEHQGPLWVGGHAGLSLHHQRAGIDNGLLDTVSWLVLIDNQ